MKSVSGMIVYHNDNLVSWCLKKQPTVAISSAEAEYISASLCMSELLFIKGIASDFDSVESVTLFVDNQSALKMMNNSENTKRAKHIDIKFHIVIKKLVTVNYVKSEENIADILTKALNSVKFNYFSDLMLKY